jgi:hypothetical protein
MTNKNISLMKKSPFLSAFLLCLAWFSHGQTDNTTLPVKSSPIEMPDHIKSRKAYKRAEWFSIQRQFPYDTFPVFTYAREMNLEIQKIKATRSDGDAYPIWETVGPNGFYYPMGNFGVVSGRVRAVAVHPTDPQTLYIGAASGGIWKTTDGGQNWQDIGHGLPSMTFGAIAIDPNNPETVYAGSGECVLIPNFHIYPGNGLYKSTDGGQTWTLITNGFGLMTHFSDLAVSPYDSNIVIASLCDGSVYSGYPFPNEGVWKSTDGGMTWTRCLDVMMPYDIAFHPTNPDIVYAAAGGFLEPMAGFFISTDQGETWTQRNTGLILPPLGGRIQFDISQSDPMIIYAVIYEFTLDGGVQTRAFKSVDGASNWTQISAGIPLGGNHGSGWSDQGYYDLCIAVDPTNSEHVLIGNIELHRTTNGSTFSPVRPYGNNSSGSLVHFDYHKLVFAPSDPNILYIGCDGGIYQSPDKGYSAVSLNQGLETLQFYRITSHPVNPEIIIGGMQDNGGVRTGDGGESWQSIIGQDAMECFFDYTNPDIFYITLNDGYLFKSLQGGLPNTFDLIYNINGSFITPIFMHPINPNILYAANTNILKSSNGGESFNVIAANVALQNISAMAQSQVNPNNMIFGTGQNHPGFDTVFMVKISTDEGITWTDVSANIPGESRWISRVETDPIDANTMYILRTGFSQGNKVWKTADLGLTWTNISGDLPDLPVNDLFIDPDNTDHLYLANDIGIYLSVNGGDSWSYASEGIPFLPCIDFDYVKIDDVSYLRIGTYGRSIYETNLNIGVGVPEKVGSRQSAIISHPNPFTGFTILEYELDQSETVNLSVYNHLGQRVAVLVKGEQAAGRQQVQWNAEGLPNGVYYYRLSILPSSPSGHANDHRLMTTGKLVKY